MKKEFIIKICNILLLQKFQKKDILKTKAYSTAHSVMAEANGYTEGMLFIHNLLNTGSIKVSLSFQARFLVFVSFAIS